MRRGQGTPWEKGAPWTMTVWKGSRQGKGSSVSIETSALARWQHAQASQSSSTPTSTGAAQLDLDGWASSARVGWGQRWTAQWQLPRPARNLDERLDAAAATPAVPRPQLADAARVLGKLVTVEELLSLSHHAEAWTAVLKQAARNFLNSYLTVHAGLPEFDAVLQSPSPQGHCRALSHPDDPALESYSRRLAELIGGIFEMLLLHQQLLSPKARQESCTLVTLGLIGDRRTGVEMRAAVQLDGMLPKPECVAECPAGYPAEHHDKRYGNPPMMPDQGARRRHTYHAYLCRVLNVRWQELVAQGQFELGAALTLLLRLGMLAGMGYTHPARWERAWGGVFGGNIHATNWICGRVRSAINLKLVDEMENDPDFHVGYGDGPCLAVHLGHVREPRSAGEVGGWIRVRARVGLGPGLHLPSSHSGHDGGSSHKNTPVNAKQLQQWLYQCAQAEERSGSSSPSRYVWCRAQLRLLLMPAWCRHPAPALSFSPTATLLTPPLHPAPRRRILSALHPDTLLVADTSSWWATGAHGSHLIAPADALANCGERTRATDTRPPPWLAQPATE